MSAPHPRVSVVMAVLDEAATLERAVGPLLRDDGVGEVEVIVADGGSTDGTRDLIDRLAAKDPRIRWIQNPGRVTPAGLNAALRSSRGDIIVRMDGHAIPDEGYLTACLRVLESSGAWNVGGRMRKEGVGRAGRAASAAASSPFGIGGGDRFHLVETAQDVDSVWLGCWPRWAFERVGMFDPTMVGAEDEELNQRILDAGGRIRFDPSISAAYLSRSSWRSLARQYLRYGMAKVRVVQSRPSVLRFRHLAPAATVAAIVGSLVLGVFDPIGMGLAGLVVLVWLVAAVVFAGRIASRFGSSMADVAAAFACIHVGYGLGTWIGLVRYAPRWFSGRRTTAPRLDGSAGP